MTGGRFDNWKFPKIEDRKIHPKYHFLITFKDNLELGECTDIGAFCFIDCKNGVVIEKNVQIGSHCSIYTHSTIDETEGKVIIKENAHIGTHSTIMPGVTIGKNAKIGAYSFVNIDIPENALAYGIPVKIIKKNKKTE